MGCQQANIIIKKYVIATKKATSANFKLKKKMHLIKWKVWNDELLLFFLNLKNNFSWMFLATKHYNLEKYKTRQPP